MDTGQILYKQLTVGDWALTVQFNKARIRSSAAKVDAASIAKRPCFLCKENLPPTQLAIDYQGRYELLQNPFPIFPKHLTVPTYEHIPQRIIGRFADMLALAKDLPAYTIFYNGPHCGASAPDHMHFQAGSRHFMPIEEQWQSRIGTHLAVEGKARLHLMDDAPRNTLLMIADKVEDAEVLFKGITTALNKMTFASAPPSPSSLKDILPLAGKELPPSNIDEINKEPDLNVLTYYEGGQWFTFIFPRTKHRPSCYFLEGEEQMVISPASVDMGGMFITAREQDFQRITAMDVEKMFLEVCWQTKEIEMFKSIMNSL